MLLREAKEILEKNGYILESEEISIDDLVAFAKLNCSKAMGAAVSVKDRCEWPLVEIDITGDAVFKKYNGTCITGYFKERTGAGARRGASKYFSIFPEEGKLVVGPGTSERVNGKLCRLITNEYTYNSWDDLIKFFNRNNFNTTKLPKTFSEAKEILKNNGFIVEAANDYDVETLVKMWIEQNKPAGENIDYSEYDDGSISIYDIIYDPHNCGDDMEQEWDFLADFENIDELKAAVGV